MTGWAIPWPQLLVSPVMQSSWHKQTAYLMATVESLMKKGLKKAMKSKKRKHNHAYDPPSSSNSNFE
jgi:hypothetical protein